MKNIFTILQKGHHRAFETIYHKYRTAFLSYAKKHNIHNDAAINIYQNALIALQAHALKTIEKQPNSYAKKYLWAIGRQLLHEHLTANEQSIPLLKEKKSDIHITADTIFREPILSTTQQTLKTQVAQLGTRCRELLTLYYYQKLTATEIVHRLQHESTEMVEQQITHCIASLKKHSNATL